MPVAGPALRAVRDFHCQRAFGATRALRNSASAPRRYHPLLISSAAAAGAAVTQLVVRRGAHRHFIGQHKRQERRKHHERLRVYAAAGEAYAATQEKALPSPLTALGTLAVGASGSVLFAYLNTPLPWMLGALAATSVAAIWGAPIKLPPKARLIMQAIVGVALGAAFDTTLWDKIVRFPLTVSGLLLYTAAATALSILFLRRFAGYGATTSFFAAVPGGLNDMTIIGADLGGDERVIALSHVIRLLIVVTFLPVLFRAILPATPAVAAAALPAAVAASPLSGLDVLLLAASAAMGPSLAGLVKLPAKYLIGPMFMSAIVHGLGLTAAKPPAALIQCAQVVIGASVGCRFVGVRPAQLLGVARTAAGSTALQLGLGVAAAALTAHLSGARRATAA